jgi:hypothetical protein
MTHEQMSDERLAKIQLLAKNDLLLEEVLSDYKRLRGERVALRGLVKALRGMVVAANEAGQIFVHVEIGEGGKLVLRAADKWLAATQGTSDVACEGCGESPTSTADADGVHLCRDCGLALVESKS